jgi:outer membrane lipoprotein-sorting protein
MFRKIMMRGLFFLSLLLVLPGNHEMVWGSDDKVPTALDARTILEKADTFLRPWKAGSVDVTMSYKNGSQIFLKTFKVYYDKNKALVVFRSPTDQIGNLILLIDNDMWYYEKGTSHAVFIPGVQKAAGQLLCADIPRLIWAKDYEAKIDKNPDSVDPGSKDLNTVKIDIKATAKGLTYKSGYAWINAETFLPIKTQLNFGSGKRARTIIFTEFVTVADRKVIRQIKLIDHMNLGRTYTLSYDNFTAEAPPENYFSDSLLPTLSKQLALRDELGKLSTPGTN